MRKATESAQTMRNPKNRLFSLPEAGLESLATSIVQIQKVLKPESLETGISGDFQCFPEERI